MILKKTIRLASILVLRKILGFSFCFLFVLEFVTHRKSFVFYNLIIRKKNLNGFPSISYCFKSKFSLLVAKNEFPFCVAEKLLRKDVKTHSTNQPTSSIVSQTNWTLSGIRSSSTSVMSATALWLGCWLANWKVGGSNPDWDKPTVFKIGIYCDCLPGVRYKDRDLNIDAVVQHIRQQLVWPIFSVNQIEERGNCIHWGNDRYGKTHA